MKTGSMTNSPIHKNPSIYSTAGFIPGPWYCYMLPPKLIVKSWNNCWKIGRKWGTGLPRFPNCVRENNLIIIL